MDLGDLTMKERGIYDRLNKMFDGRDEVWAILQGINGDRHIKDYPSATKQDIIVAIFTRVRESNNYDLRALDEAVRAGATVQSIIDGVTQGS